tara:strand:- start:535 stop:930 length:396 start_codon:yes stop_codon:yes gene_type:complete
MTDRELMQQALDALEEAWYHVGTFQPTEKAIELYDEARAALNERLAQPEQEPIITKDGEGMLLHGGWHSLSDGTKLYADPPQRKPLTDKQILADKTLRYYFGQNGGAGPVSKQGRKVVDAIEAAHGIKDES